MKKLFSVLVVVIILASLFTFGASAANNTIIAFSSNTITIGDKVTVTVTLNSDQPIYAYDYTLKYDATKLSYENASGIIHDANAASGEKTLTFRHTFTSIAVGTALIQTADCKVSSDGISEIGLTAAGANLTIKDVALSNNANLKSLSVSAGTLSPKFNKNTVNYTLSVPYETEKLNVYATADDTKAKVNVTNPTNLSVGTNTINVTVTAQDGSSKIYKIVATRRQKGDETVSEPEPEPVIPNNPYETILGGNTYEVLTEIPTENILKGFTTSTAEYNGQQVAVIRDKSNEFTVYYLRESGKTEIAPYTYNVELETFEALKHYSFGDSVYIFTDFPDGVTMPVSYYSTYAQIGNYSVMVYMHNDSQMSDFAYAYCFVNGEYGLYRYDSKEGTIQRYPDVNLVDAPAVSAPIKDNFAKRWSTLTTQSKLLMIAFIVAGLCAVLLVVFLAYKAFNLFFNRDKIDNSDIEEYNFDDVTVIGDDKNLNE